MSKEVTSRRDFLYQLGITISGSLFCPQWSFAQNRLGTLLAPFTRYKNGKNEYGVLKLNLDNGRIHVFSTKEMFHKPCVNSENPMHFACAAQHSLSLSQWDFNTGKELTITPSSNNLLYYGHAAYSADGKFIYATTSDKKNKKTYNPEFYLTKIETTSGKIVHQILLSNTEKGWHDCQLSHDKKYVITAGGNSILYIDVQSDKIVKKISVDESAGFLNHLSVSPQGHLAFQKNSVEGEEEVAFSNAKLVTFNNRNKFIGEVDSEFFHEKVGKEQLFGVNFCQNSKFIAMSFPLMDHLFFLDFKKNKIVKDYILKAPHGMSLSLDNRYFVSTSLSGVNYYSVETLDPAPAGPSFYKEFKDFFGELQFPSRFTHTEIVDI